ncbi:TetR/AcrR family transcriptional regulator [Solihabitans fulvus]|uniref:TetR/AcrR family transcriptional regulator n=1 Tax=Solihabitans fulvus TaxID=1892852 RepID=A0A5B2XQW0_9PSEU|nr:TetR/AcrR family transcriptional regulator [Solihabitans fulvus]KAA2265261.1 TetR/AcrR family transcriptional regulator [Solihabitans fulvus]
MPKIVDPDLRRRAVAEAVFRVVRRDGVEQASLRNVAAEAGLAIGSVRHYFASHDELLVFALQELSAQVGQRLRAHADRLFAAAEAGARRMLVEDLLAELLPLDTRRHEEAVVWLAFSTAARTRPSLRPHAREAYDGLRMVGARVLAEAQRLGRLVDGLDLELENERLCALLDGLAVDAVLWPERMTPELMNAVLRRHLDSITIPH